MLVLYMSWQPRRRPGAVGRMVAMCSQHPLRLVVGAGTWGAIFKWPTLGVKLEYRTRGHMYVSALYVIAASDKAGGSRTHGRNVLSVHPLRLVVSAGTWGAIVKWPNLGVK